MSELTEARTTAQSDSRRSDPESKDGTNSGWQAGYRQAIRGAQGYDAQAEVTRAPAADASWPPAPPGAELPAFSHANGKAKLKSQAGSAADKAGQQVFRGDDPNGRVHESAGYVDTDGKFGVERARISQSKEGATVRTAGALDGASEKRRRRTPIASSLSLRPTTWRPSRGTSPAFRAERAKRASAP